MTAAADNAPKGAGIRTLAERALLWWWSELRGLFDDVTRRLDPASRNAVVIEAGERYWTLRRRQRVLGQIDRTTSDEAEARLALRHLVLAARRGGVVMVEIPPERVLAKRILLPAVARGEIDRVLQFEIARHFPFPAERVHFRHLIVGRHGDGSGKSAIEVEIVAVPRDIVTAILAELAGAGLRPKSIAVAAGETKLALPVAALGRGPALGRGERALLVTLACLAVAALAAPVLHDRMRLGAVEREIAALQPRAQAIRTARDRSSRAAERTAAPLRLAASRPALVAVLAALSKAVPDGSWLMSLGISGHELTLDGLSPSAATLALALDASSAFEKVTFRATILRDPATGLEHFQLSAAIPEATP